MAAAVGVVGDFDPTNPTHTLTSAALEHLELTFDWVPTSAVTAPAERRLGGYAGLWIAPASPYRSMEGALTAIRYARERGVPLVGTWGGFQHAIVEFARNVLGIRDADHAETSPDAERLVITALTCSLVGQQQSVRLVAGTRAAALYGAETAVEPYYCNYGVNGQYRQRLVDGGLRVSGIGEEGEIRIIELPDHPFFLATLFLPQARSTSRDPHPLLLGYAAALGGRG